MEGKLFPLNFLPGIKQDGTDFASKYWLSGTWMRFQRGLPRKIGGYKKISPINGFPMDTTNFRGVLIINNSPNFNMYYGTEDELRYFTMDIQGNGLSETFDRTPLAFVANMDNDWNFETMYSTLDNGSILIAHAAPNLSALDSSIETPIYYGALTGPAANDRLVPAVESVTSLNPGELIVTSGGVCVLHPILFIFGNDGYVSWTAANDPTTIRGQVRAASGKIIAGFATRGGNSSPAGLLWSLDSLIRVTFTPGVGFGDVDFTFDTVASSCSILSANCIAEFNGYFMWPGVDNFLIYNGTVSTVRNDMNLDYFYENLNFAARSKVWAYKDTEFNEIWFFFPFGNATECNHAVVYNYLENSWYNTAISESILQGDEYVQVIGYRTCGTFSPMFGSGVWASPIIDDLGNALWEQEEGLDINQEGALSPIPFSIQSGDISWCALGPNGQFIGTDRQVDIQRFEPDFITGNPDTEITLEILTRDYAQADEVIYPLDPAIPITFTGSTRKVDLNIQGRQMRLQFSCNQVGSDFQFGQNLMLLRMGDGRQ